MNYNYSFIDGYPTKIDYNQNIPIIGWYARRQLGYLLLFIIFISIIYFFFIRQQTDIISIGCIRNGCNATSAIGNEIISDNCIGIGCHAGDCYGEECVAGSCHGVGCIGGNCYGTNCIVGKCYDPNCPEDKENRGLCKPNCSWGRAYEMPKSKNKYYEKIKTYLPQNTYFNKNNCIKPNLISENLLKDNNLLYNINIKGAYYYNGEFLSLNEIKTKIAKGLIIDDKKGLIRYNDPIISTIPNLYKNNNCNWQTNNINAKYTPTYNKTTVNNVDNYTYNWISFKLPVPILDTKGNETMCSALANLGHHSMTNIIFNLDIEQIKDILNIQNLSTKMANTHTINNLLQSNNYSQIKTYMDSTDFFQDTITVDSIINILLTANKDIFNKLEDIRGTIMTCSCDNCRLTGIRTLSYDCFPTDLFGNILPCKDRAYIWNKTIVNYDPNVVIDNSIITYELIELKRPINDIFTTDEKTLFVDKEHSIRNHHLMLYLKTDIINNIITYKCIFCSKTSDIYLPKILTNQTIIHEIGIKYSLLNCVRPDDFNHYIIEWADEDKILYKCIKCNKQTN